MVKGIEARLYRERWFSNKQHGEKRILYIPGIALIQYDNHETVKYIAHASNAIYYSKLARRALQFRGQVEKVVLSKEGVDVLNKAGRERKGKTELVLAAKFLVQEV